MRWCRPRIPSTCNLGDNWYQVSGDQKLCIINEWVQRVGWNLQILSLGRHSWSSSVAKVWVYYRENIKQVRIRSFCSRLWYWSICLLPGNPILHPIITTQCQPRPFYSQAQMWPCCSHDPLGVPTNLSLSHHSAHTEPISKGHCWKWVKVTGYWRCN